MRANALTGAVLTVAAVLLILLSSALGLAVESVALMGAGAGATLGLVPGRRMEGRMIGFLVGFGLSWLGYLVRAGFLPDTSAGHATAVGLVLALCTVVAAASRGLVPLWSLVLGAAVLAGSYEATYLAAPSQVMRTSLSSSTSVLLAVAFGFFAAALVAPGRDSAGVTEAPEPTGDHPTAVNLATPATTSGSGEDHEPSESPDLMREDAP